MRKRARGTGARMGACAVLCLALWACGGSGTTADLAPEPDVVPDEVATTCRNDLDCAAETGGNPCLKATCDAGQGLCFTSADPAAEGAACDDGDACTEGDACHAGACEGDAKACDDGNACTADTCDSGSGQCTFDQLPNGTACDDGNVCTGGDKCQAGVCNAGSNTCACQVDTDCDAWDDGDLCNGTLVCGADHTCSVDPATVVTCDASADTDCRVATCAPATGACAPMPVNEGGACQPPDPCLEAGQCVTGTCQGGTARTCDDGDACTIDSCAASTGACAHEPADPGSPCDDGVTCTHGETCAADGACVPAATDDCDDGNPCTDDTCDTLLGGCVHQTTEPGTACDDGDPCSTDDRCNAAHACVPTGYVHCDDDNACTGDACDPATGACSFPLLPAGSPCADADLCTVDDACDDQGHCLAGTPTDCDDDNACTSDQCDPLTGACELTPLEPGAPCSDLDACTTGDACNATGACVTTGAVDCDDHQECTIDSCDPTSGACSHLAVDEGTPCTDGDACTTGDACTAAGTCAPAGVVDCDDGEECTTDACQPATGQCVSDPVDDGTPCDDGDGCTLDDSCQAGACQIWVPKSCDDDNACTTDSCRSSDGACLHDGAPHEDDACTHADTCLTGTRCHAGLCAGGAPIALCCHAAADCATGEGCQTFQCVDERCVYAPEVCAGESAGCTTKLCDVAPGCGGAAVSLAGRVVVYERRFADETGIALVADPVGAFAVTDPGLSLAAEAPGTLMLKPLRLPRGTTTLRVRVAEPASPGEGALPLSVGELDQTSLAGAVVDLEDAPGFEVVYDVSSATDRSAAYRVTLTDPAWVLEGVQVVHHGGEGCPSLLGPEAILWLDQGGAAQQVTSCANAAGEKLVVWTETATKTRLAWRLWNGAWWSETFTAGGEFDLLAESSLHCIATSTGWAIAYGSVLDAGVASARWVVVDAAGVATSINPVSLETGDHAETPALATLPNGDVVIAFTSDVVDGDGVGVALARFAPDGTPVGTANVQVNETTNGSQRRPTIAVNDTRVFVAWESKTGALSKTKLYHRFFDHSLAPTLPEAEFAASSDVEYLRPTSAPIAAEKGHFLVAYETIGKAVDAGSGVSFSLFDLAGVEAENEKFLAVDKANDQKRPLAVAVPGGVLVQWLSDHASKNTFDLVSARLDAVGLQGNARVAFDIDAIGKALPALPGAVEHVFVKDGKVSLARLGLACDVGLYDCSTGTPGVCVDTDQYLPLVDGCLGGSCSGVCP